MALLVFGLAAFNWLVPPATEGQANTLRIIGCFWTGIAIGQCLRLIYPEK